jgi:hypothetical protein
MMERAMPVQTQFGEIHGRNAFYLDSFTQQGLSLVFAGELNADLCRGEVHKGHWLKYQLTFRGVLGYDCRELEVSRWPTESSFDEVHDSEWLPQLALEKRVREMSHELKSVSPRDYILSTYDWIYRIAATHFELVILEERAKSPKKGSRKTSGG